MFLFKKITLEVPFLFLGHNFECGFIGQARCGWVRDFQGNKTRRVCLISCGLRWIILSGGSKGN